MLSPEQKELLVKRNAISLLEKRKERYSYYGILNEYQLYGSKDLEYCKLNPKQHFMFKRVLHGLNVYSKEEIANMHWDKKRRIKKVWKRAQDTLNVWKQVITNKRCNDWLSNHAIEFDGFGNIPWIRSIMEVPVTCTDKTYINKMTLKQVGLTYEDVILKFMSVGLLPRNFLSVK